jgi:ArsR family transcriptional regulator
LSKDAELVKKLKDATLKDVVAIPKVLGHPSRIAIFEFIIKLNSCVCGDLVKDIGLAQPAIYQNLKE